MIRFCNCAVVIVALTTVTIFPGNAHAQDGSRFLKWVGNDARNLVQVPSASSMLVVTTSVAALGALSYLDDGISHELQEGYSGVFEDYVNAANYLGDPRMNLVALGVFGVSLSTRNTTFQDAAFTSLEAVAFAGLINVSIKLLVGRARPEEDKGPHSFSPFAGNQSFPSGHTAKAFALLTPWAMYYPSVATYGLLAVGAGGTALARMAKDKHWMTDVLAGGAVGFFVAGSLTRRHQQASSESRLAISLAPGGFLVAIRL